MISLEPQNPMNRAMMPILIFEVIVFALGIPGMILLSNVSTSLALGATGVACLLAIAASGTLKKPWGYPLGWLTQIVGIALGFLTPMMFAAGGIFALVWLGCFVLGKRIERHQRVSAR